MSIINGFGGGAPKDELTKNLLMCSDRYNVPIITLDETTSKYVFTLPYDILSYEVGKLIYIQGVTYNEVNEYVNPYLNVGGLGNIPINGTVKAGKCYNLMYDGTQFLLQLSTMGLTGTTYVFTESGTYTIDPDLVYAITLVGGGGGGARYSFYANSGDATYGGGGGITIGEYHPVSSTFDVIIGAAGGNSSGVSGSQAKGGTGGTTTAGGFVAEGGTGGASYDSGTNTTFDGTTAEGGSRDGYYYNGSYYGKAGYGTSSKATSGIVVLVPIL